MVLKKDFGNDNIYPYHKTFFIFPPFYKGKKAAAEGSYFFALFYLITY